MAWGWAIERLVPFEGARATRGSKPGCSRQGRYSWGSESACAHDGELGRDARGGEPRPRQLCSELVAAPRRTRSKTRIGFLKLRITGGPAIASWRRIRRLFWTHAPHLPPAWAWRNRCRHWAIFTAAEIDYWANFAARSSIEERCGRDLAEKGRRHPYDGTRAKSLQPEGASSDRNAVVKTNPAPPAALVAPPQHP